MDCRRIAKTALLAAGLAATQAQAQCLLPIERSLLEPTTIDGQAHLAVPQSVVDQLDCIDRDAIAASADAITELRRKVAEYQTLNDQLAARIERYRELMDEMEANFQDTITLTDKYDTQVEQYDALAEKYADVVRDYDELTEQYRDIALGSRSGLSFDIGAGATDRGDPAALVGVGYSRIKLWGVVDENRSTLLIGTNFPF